MQSEQPINALHVIAKGTVRATYPGGEFYLYKGVIGACELFFDSHFITYQTEEASSIGSYPYSVTQLSGILHTNAEMSARIVTSMFRQVQEILDQYELARFDCDNFYHYLMDSYDGDRNFCSKHSISARATFPAGLAVTTHSSVSLFPQPLSKDRIPTFCRDFC